MCGRQFMTHMTHHDAFFHRRRLVCVCARTRMGTNRECVMVRHASWLGMRRPARQPTRPASGGVARMLGGFTKVSGNAKKGIGAPDSAGEPR